MPDETSSYDRLWRSKEASALVHADPATRNEQQLAALNVAAIADRAQLAQISPLPMVKPAIGWSSFDLDPATMSPDIAANTGWNIMLTHSPWTTLVRAGDVRWQDHVWGAASSPTPGTTPNYPPAPGTYYSTVFAGRLLLQLPGDADVSIWRLTSTAARIYSAGVGGGSTDKNMRMLFTSNGTPGNANITCAYVHDTAQGVTAVGGQMGVAHATYGAPAVHLALEAFASQVGHTTGRYLRAGVRPLFTGGSCSITSGALIESGHGNGVLANMQRVGLRLMNGPAGNTFSSVLSAPIELFYIRRRSHRQDAFF